MINIYYDTEYNKLKDSFADPRNHIHIKKNGSFSSNTDVLYFLQQHDIPFSCQSTMNFKETEEENNFYFLEPWLLFPNQDFLKKIPKNTLKLIRSKKLKLVIFFPHEGFDLYLFNWIENIHKSIKKKKLVGSKIFLIFGDMNIEKNYEIFNRKNKQSALFTKVYGIDFFKSNYYINHTYQYNNVVIDHSVNKEKVFLNYNGAIRYHRFIAVSEIKRRNLEQYGYVSFIGRHHNNDLSGPRYYGEERIKNLGGNDVQLEHFINYMENWKPQLIDFKLNELMADYNKFDLYHYNTSYFSLVTETLVSNSFFITEKTYKPIVLEHPFIIYGCPGTLEYLRTQGYETFPEFFDESYDLDANEISRLNKILDNIEKFSNLSNSEKQKRYRDIIPKLKHNRNNFLNTHKDSKILEIFKDIISR